MVNARTVTVQPLSYLTQTLPAQLPPIFEQAQHTTANHRKNIVALRKIQVACATVTEETSKGTKLLGEKAFNTMFVDMVNRVLGVKKGVAVADRVVKFVANYVAYTTEQDVASRPEGEEDIDTAASRFVNKLLKHLLSGMEAKDKNVRFRVTLLTVSMINGLGEMDDDVYMSLKSCLLDRARDKEAAVRVQAALGLAKLQSGEDEEDLEEGEESLADVLLDLLRYDPAAEVRRAALYNLPCTPRTLPHILARTRDIDPILRRTVYHGSLSAAALPDSRILTIAQREDAVKHGLGDRESAVRKAAAGMLGGWVDQTGGDLLEFLSRLDVVNSKVAEDALLSVFTTRPEIFDQVEFDEEYWATLTPDKAFLARVFVDHCVTTNDLARLEEALPVVTALAFLVQDEFNKLVPSVNTEESDIAERSFIVGELLSLAVNLDYADEIGRRKMFSLAREMLSQDNLPENLIPRSLDVLGKICDTERDLIRVVVDVISGLREGEGEEDMDVPESQDSTYSTTPSRARTGVPRFDTAKDPEEKMQAALVDLRCLVICIGMLERINSTLVDNAVLTGLMAELIIPAVENKEEPALRDQGIVCLGLIGLIDLTTASGSLSLYVNLVNKADDELKSKIVRILFDVFMVHDIALLVSGVMAVESVWELIQFLLSQPSADVQAVAAEGTAKLILAGKISDASMLRSLVLLYFSPESVDNQALRQCLTYFFPVYCYSSSENQRTLLSVFTESLEVLQQILEEVEGEQDMPPLAQIGLMMVDWLDPLKTVERQGAVIDYAIHLELALEICKSLLEEESKDVRKAMVSWLSKLNLPDSDASNETAVRMLELLLGGIKDKRPLSDATSRNSLNKFSSALLKKYPEHLDNFDAEAFAETEIEVVQALVSLIDGVRPTDDAASEAGSRRPSTSRAKRGTRSASRETSMALTETSDGNSAGSDEEEILPKSRRITRGKGQQMSKVVEEEEGETETQDEDADTDAGAAGGRAQKSRGEDEDDDVESMLDASF